VVLDGDTLTATPLVAAMFPGVIIPVPFAKTPTRLAELPGATVVGLAVKLEMVGSGALKLFKVPFVQPVRPVKHKIMRKNAEEEETITRFMPAPKTEAKKMTFSASMAGAILDILLGPYLIFSIISTTPDRRK